MKYAYLWNKETPVEREFECKCCGQYVHVTKREDHRMVFCCAYCEREYWRHRDRYDRKKRMRQGYVPNLLQKRAENKRRQGL